MAPVKPHEYEAYFKLQAIKYAAENGNRAAARHFNVNESMVRKWRKQESELRQVRKTKLSFCGNKARWPELEDRVEQLVVEQRTTGRASLLSPFDKRPKKAVAQRLPANYQERVAIFCTYCRDKITAPSHIYEAAVGELCHHMRVDCRRMGYDTVFMYCKSFHKSRHPR
ncbi:hypothetical protein D4764_01G0017720 [Takifugu flavidus]|uniref:Brinker DNA-binding domain-containing protein n=1 Tax=Takifugu flavidus TaxID=433684 RepID=A0A5C6PTX0_9TELE|nr:hypothetical protein D4764_01G0017720 [Takifugu flavidus]